LRERHSGNQDNSRAQSKRHILFAEKTVMAIIDLLPQMIDLYYGQGLPTKQVAITVGISKTSVKRILKKSGYILRNPSEAMKLACERRRAQIIIYERTPKIRQQISRALKQYYTLNPNPMLGRHHTPETVAKLQGRHYSSETLAKMSEGQKRRIDRPMLGKHHSEKSKGVIRDKTINRWKDPAFRERMRNTVGGMKLKISAIQKVNWKTEEYRAKVVPACLKSRRPTSLERMFNALIDKYSLPYKYVGDGSFIIGGLNPDYVNVNGEKIAIEIFGEYWHKRDKEYRRSEAGRRQILRDFGWHLIVIWGNELKTLSEEAILQKISREEYHA